MSLTQYSQNALPEHLPGAQNSVTTLHAIHKVTLTWEPMGCSWPQRMFFTRAKPLTKSKLSLSKACGPMGTTLEDKELYNVFLGDISKI